MLRASVYALWFSNFLPVAREVSPIIQPIVHSSFEVMHGPPTSDMMYRRPASTSTPVSASQNPSKLRCAVANPDTTYPLPATDVLPAHHIPPFTRLRILKFSAASHERINPSQLAHRASSSNGGPGVPRTHHFPLFARFKFPKRHRHAITTTLGISPSARQRCHQHRRAQITCLGFP
ncbi:hypothetical protein DFH09DRAFT_1202054 [Mycena vulgaris]|nr:hypothetical protein DFH09DRAFT_1202054 [Mycena vulgaris]